MRKNRQWRQIWAVLLIGTVLCGVWLSGCGQQDNPELDQRKKVAGELRDSKLYKQAIAEYKELLGAEGVSDNQRGSIAFLIGQIYFEDLKSYEDAASYYVRARSYDSTGAYMDDLSRNLVAALEKSGKYLDAKHELANLTDLDADKTPSGTIPVAVVSGDTVWLEELDSQIQTLPPALQKQMLTPEAKQDFLRQYIGMDLIAQSAIREGLDRDPDFQMRKEMLVKKLLMEKYIAEKILPELSMEPTDIRNYFEANKDAKYKGQKFENIVNQVAQDYQTEKSAAAYMDSVAELAKIENVIFLDQNIK